MFTRYILLLALIFNLLLTGLAKGQDKRKSVIPLESAIQVFSKSIENVQKIDEYSGMLVNRERNRDGILQEWNFWRLKVRSHSKQISACNLKPRRGTELLFQKGKHDDKILVYHGGKGCGYRWARIDPTSKTAICNLRYPFPEKNILNLSNHYLAYLKKLQNRKGVEVRRLNNCKINKRCSSKLEVILNANFKLKFSKLEIYFDKEYQIPVRFAGYGLQKPDSQEPLLIEEYTFVDLNISPAFTDREFVDVFASRTPRRQSLNQNKGEHHFLVLWSSVKVMSEFIARLGLHCLL